MSPGFSVIARQTFLLYEDWRELHEGFVSGVVIPFAFRRRNGAMKYHRDENGMLNMTGNCFRQDSDNHVRRVFRICAEIPSAVQSGNRMRQ